MGGDPDAEIENLHHQHGQIITVIHDALRKYDMLAQEMSKSSNPAVQVQGQRMLQSNGVRQMKEILSGIGDDIYVIKSRMGG